MNRVTPDRARHEVVLALIVIALAVAVFLGGALVTWGG